MQKEYSTRSVPPGSRNVFTGSPRYPYKQGFPGVHAFRPEHSTGQFSAIGYNSSCPPATARCLYRDVVRTVSHRATPCGCSLNG